MLAQSILKRKFPTVHKPLRIYAPQKGPLEKKKPQVLFSEFYGISIGTKRVSLIWIMGYCKSMPADYHGVSS